MTRLDVHVHATIFYDGRRESRYIAVFDAVYVT